MQIYAFGSICRGEVDHASDTDLLACAENQESLSLDSSKFSIYEHAKIRKIWNQGNPFAWHLHLESKLIYSSNGHDFIHSLGSPQKYSSLDVDLDKFAILFETAKNALHTDNKNVIFNLSCAYLAIRNAATCYSLTTSKPEFSRHSALRISTPLQIDISTYELLLRARLLSSRGYGKLLSQEETKTAISSLPAASEWLKILKGNSYES